MMLLLPIVYSAADVFFALALIFDLVYFILRTEMRWIFGNSTSWAFRCRPENKDAMDAAVLTHNLQTFASYVGPAIAMTERLGCIRRRSVLTSRLIMWYVSRFRVETAHVWGEGACLKNEFPNYLTALELPELLVGHACTRIVLYNQNGERLTVFTRCVDGDWVRAEQADDRPESQFTSDALLDIQQRHRRRETVRIFDRGWSMLPKRLEHRPGLRRSVL